MSDQQSAPKPKRRVPTGRPPHRWQKGAPSPNPNGRPRAGLAFAERLRERLNPDTVIDLALALAADESVSVERRLSALLPFVQLGYLRPPTSINAAITTEPATARDWQAMPIEERRELLEKLRSVPELADKT